MDIPRWTPTIASAPARIYAGLFAGLGATRAMANERLIAWSTSAGSPMFAIIKPLDGRKATPGNGTTISIYGDSRAKFNALNAKALTLGGADERAPGPRDDGFYSGNCRDLDGNKVLFFNM